MPVKKTATAKKTLSAKEMKKLKGGDRVQHADLSITKLTDASSAKLF